MMERTFDLRRRARPSSIPPLIDRIEVAAAFESGLAEVERRWPDAPVNADAFAAHVRAHVGAQRDLSGMLPRFRVDDLFLAWWAMTSPEGIAAFEYELGDDLRRIISRFPRLDPDELMQLVRVKLFVGEDARIAEFSGFGSLRSWIDVVAAQVVIDAAHALAEARDAEADALVALVASPRGDLQPAIERAFAEAVARLPRRERTFLRHAAIDRLALDQIANAYQLHRATVARTLATTRMQLLAETRAALLAEQSSALADVDVDAVLDLALTRVLCSRA